MTHPDERDFHQRTLEYTGGLVPVSPAGVCTGPGTASLLAGQVSVLSAVNLLARTHPRVLICVPDVPLLVDLPLGATSLQEACRQLAESVRPDFAVELVDRIPDDVDTIGIGNDAPHGTVYAGGRRWTALTSATPVEITQDPSSMLGSALAVVLAHGYIFRRSIGETSQVDWGVSLWSLTETTEATGPSELDPVDVGTVWLIGAGAVGSCLAWWLRMIGVRGTWHVIDDDIVKGLNVARSLTFFWGDIDGVASSPSFKCDSVARWLPGAIAHRVRWDTFRRGGDSLPDVIVPVANEDGVRGKVAHLGHPAVIHATTGPRSVSELHRHIPGRDGCLSCRLPADAPTFQCATESSGEQTYLVLGDAALPFLSAGAGLLLLTGLLKLQLGVWDQRDVNQWRLHFGGPTIQRVSWSCSAGCESVPSPRTRAAVHNQCRWAHLDRDAAGLEHLDGGWDPGG